ncbi:MAG: hypothetical protein V1770_01690 [bacterium]
MREFKNINNSNLSIMSECPLCKSKGVDLNVIEENSDGYLLHSKCRKCSNSIIMIAVNNEMGINIIGMNTDLSIDEFIKFRSLGKSIELDDVLTFHKKSMLENFTIELIRNNIGISTHA